MNELQSFFSNFRNDDDDDALTLATYYTAFIITISDLKLDFLFFSSKNAIAKRKQNGHRLNVKWSKKWTNEKSLTERQ